MNLLIASSHRCIQVIAGVLGRAGEAGQKLRLAAAKRGTITYSPAQGLVMPGSEDEDGASIEVSTGRLGDNANTDELEAKLDDVKNREHHRVKGGRQLNKDA